MKLFNIRNRKIRWSAILVGVVFTFFATQCTEISDGSQKTGNFANPNGDSELTLLMRQMFDDCMRIKEEVKKGASPEIKASWDAIYTAESTDTDKTNSQPFKEFGLSYQAAIESLKNAEGEDISEQYQAMVQSCMNCHQSMCPGPMVRIKKLFLPKS